MTVTVPKVVAMPITTNTTVIRTCVAMTMTIHMPMPKSVTITVAVPMTTLNVTGTVIMIVPRL